MSSRPNQTSLRWARKKRGRLVGWPIRGFVRGPAKIRGQKPALAIPTIVREVTTRRGTRRGRNYPLGRFCANVCRLVGNDSLTGFVLPLAVINDALVDIFQLEAHLRQMEHCVENGRRDTKILVVCRMSITDSASKLPNDSYQLIEPLKSPPCTHYYR